MFPFEKYDFKWIPQQIWHYRSMPFGVWTCCIHPNEINEVEYINLENFIKNNCNNFISINQLNYKISILSKFLNLIFNTIYWKLKKVH